MQEYSLENIQNKVKEMIAKQGKPNILLCGITGAGKDSLINFIFNENVAHPSNMNPQTIKNDIEFYEGNSVNIYNSMGYEIGSEKQTQYFQIIFDNFLQKQDNLEETKRVNLVWYTIPASGTKYTDLDIKLIKQIHNLGLPIGILLTKIDDISVEDLSIFVGSLKKDLPNIPLFQLSIDKNPLVQQDCHWQELEAWSYENLPVSLQARFVSALRTGLVEKHKEAEKLVDTFKKKMFCEVMSSNRVVEEQTAMLVGICRIYNISVDNENLQKEITSRTLDKIAKCIYGFLQLVHSNAERIPLPKKWERYRHMIASGLRLLTAGLSRVFPTLFTGQLGQAFISLCEKQAQDMLDGKKTYFDIETILTSADYAGQVIEKITEQISNMNQQEKEELLLEQQEKNND